MTVACTTNPDEYFIPLRLPDEQCERLYRAAEALPASKRVQLRLELIREQVFAQYLLYHSLLYSPCSAPSSCSPA